MIALIKDNLDRIKDVCKQHHVKSLYLIGSAVNEKSFSSASDIDLLYKFNKHEINEMDYADNFFSLLFALKDIFKREVDLVAEEKLKNPFFIERISSNKQAIYES
jgi:predicted nucleotidyltransferase